MMLVRTPFPEKTESALGYALRLSETNGYNTPWYVFNLAGLPQGKMVRAGFNIEMLSSVLGYSPEELAHWNYSDDTGGTRAFKLLGHFLGSSLATSPLQLRHPRICPDCATESAFIDSFWDLNVAVACPKHARRAVSMCPSCGERLRWFRPGLTTCRCGADLTTAPSEPVEADVAEFMGLLMAKLHRTPMSEAPNTSGFPVDILESMTLSAMLALLAVLGDFSRQLHEEPLNPVTSDAELAIATLKDWPNEHYRFLHRLGTKFIQERPKVIGFAKQFAPYCNRVFKNKMLASHIEPFRAAFVQFGATEWGQAVVDAKQRLSKTIGVKKRFAPIAEYAREHRLSSAALTRLMSDGAIVTKRVVSSSYHRIIVDVELSANHIGERGNINSRQAAALMGLPVSVIKHLRAIGTIPTQLRRGTVSSWHSEDVEAFIRLILEKIVLLETPPPNSVSLEKVMGLKFRNALAKAELADRALKGELQVLGRTGGTFGDLLLNQDEVDALALRTRVRLADNTYTLPEAGKLCGIDSCCVESAIEAGLLAAVTIGAHARVTKASIDAFSAAFATLSTLATELGTSSMRLRQECERLDVPLRFLTRKGKDRTQAFISKTDVPKLVEVFKTFQAERAAAIARRPPGATHRLSVDIANSGLTATEFYLQKLRSYLDDLIANGGTLPRRDGQPNKVAIARACGFGRDILYNYQPVIAVLEKFSQDERERLSEKALAPIEKLKHYLAGKEAAGAPLPRCANGDLNKLQIAREAGFHRNLLYNNTEALNLLHARAWKAA